AGWTPTSPASPRIRRYRGALPSTPSSAGERHTQHSSALLARRFAALRPRRVPIPRSTTPRAQAGIRARRRLRIRDIVSETVRSRYERDLSHHPAPQQVLEGTRHILERVLVRPNGVDVPTGDHLEQITEQHPLCVRVLHGPDAPVDAEHGPV